MRLFDQLASLCFSEELVGGDQGHEEVRTHEAVVDGSDLCGVASPDEAAETHGELLEGRDSFDGDEDVSDVHQRDEPLDRRAPEEDRERAGRTLSEASDGSWVTEAYLASCT